MFTANHPHPLRWLARESFCLTVQQAKVHACSTPSAPSSIAVRLVPPSVSELQITATNLRSTKWSLRAQSSPWIACLRHQCPSFHPLKHMDWLQALPHWQGGICATSMTWWRHPAPIAACIAGACKLKYWDAWFYKHQVQSSNGLISPL